MLSIFRKTPTVDSAISSITKVIDDLAAVVSTGEADKKSIREEISALEEAEKTISSDITRASAIREKLNALLS